MTEPTSWTWGAGWAVAAGTLGAFFAAIGVSWPIVSLAICGALLGAPAAPQLGRFGAIITFPASVLFSAKTGAVFAVPVAAMIPGGGVAPGELAGWLGAVSGIILHPAISGFVKSLPGFIGARMGAANTQDEKR